MSTLNLDDNQARYIIRGYTPGSIKINDTLYTQSIIVSPSELITDWEPVSANDLLAEHFAKIEALKPTIVLIGTGEHHVILSPAIYGNLINCGIGVEVMSSPAACRTYNALSSENRVVVAALLIK